MLLIEWEDRLTVNIKAFDNQHKKLIDLINKLHDAMTVGKSTEVMEGILTELVSYTGTHFSDEQAQLQKYGYPEFVQHMKEHDDLTKKTIEMRDYLKAGRAIVSVEVMSFLKNWLKDHILGTDKKYSAYINSKGVY